MQSWTRTWSIVSARPRSGRRRLSFGGSINEHVTAAESPRHRLRAATWIRKNPQARLHVVDAPPAVVVDSLTVVRGGGPVLRDVSLAVPAGTVTGLLGPSGCGKTTLMRSIVGVQRVVSGTVTVLGEPAGSPGLRRRVAYVTQSPSIYGDLTVRENLRYFARLVGAGHRAVDGALRTVGLLSQADARVGRLSGGQRARASLASPIFRG